LLFGLDTVAYGISTLIACALALMVLGFESRRALNRLFALFALAAACWTATAMFLRLALWFERGTPSSLGELSALAFLLLGPPLLAFTTRYVDRRSLWDDAAAVLGLGITFAVALPLFRGQMVYGHYLGANGTTHHTLSTPGFLVAVLPALFMARALWLFWQERRRTAEPYLALSVLILLAGLVVGGVLDIPFPILSFTTLGSVSILGYGVVSRQLFNPLRERTDALQREITRRQTVEEALRHSEQRYRSLFDGVPLGLYRTTPDGRILDANLALVDMLGLPDRASLLSSNAADFYLEPGDRLKWQSLAAHQGVVRDFETRFRRHDGQIIWMRNNAHAVWDGQGQIRYFEGSLEDVTRRRHLEDQFRQVQKMDALGRLAGGVAHDFNNLLTVIRVSGQMLGRHLLPQDPAWEHLRQIQEAGERAAALTRQLLSFSRQGSAEPRVIYLDRAIEDLTRMLRRIIGEDVQLRTLAPGDLWPVYIDPSHLDQIVVNLAVNARDAMPGGGILTIETANVVLDDDAAGQHVDAQPGEHVRLALGDTGVGMDDRVKARLFEPFFTTKERGKGTGLGLSTVYGIVKQSGGHIQVHSEQGQGTTFEIYLPRAA
jgi:PAS domain S-box-containing protein